MDFAKIKALMIDIDDTITRLRMDENGKPVVDPNTGSLFNVLQSAAVKMAGLAPEEAAARIAKIQTGMNWWHWSDFIVALELDPKDFWDYAYETERHYLEATGDEIRPALERLREAGVLLYITSNNPSSGILHKLRLAGVGHVNGAPLFHQVLGPPEIQAMKWDQIYWKKVLAHAALTGSETAVVGDSLRDDYEMPHSVGIAGTFLISRSQDFSAEDTDSLIHVQNFDQIADRLLAARGNSGTKRPARKSRRA